MLEWLTRKTNRCLFAFRLEFACCLFHLGAEKGTALYAHIAPHPSNFKLGSLAKPKTTHHGAGRSEMFNQEGTLESDSLGLNAGPATHSSTSPGGNVLTFPELFFFCKTGTKPIPTS